MSLRAIASPEIDEEQGLHAVSAWLDEWQVFLARSKYYHALCPPDDIPEDFPTVPRAGDADLAATIAAFADETNCPSAIKLRQANITLYGELQHAVRGFPLLAKAVKAARTYKSAMRSIVELQRGHRTTHVSSLRSDIKTVFQTIHSQQELRLAVLKANEINDNLRTMRVAAAPGMDTPLADFSASEMREMLIASFGLPGVDLQTEHREATCDPNSTRFDTYDKLCVFVNNLTAYSAPTPPSASALPPSARAATTQRQWMCFKCAKTFPDRAAFRSHISSSNGCTVTQQCTQRGCADPSSHTTRAHDEWLRITQATRSRQGGRGNGTRAKKADKPKPNNNRRQGDNTSANNNNRQQQNDNTTSFLPFGCAARLGSRPTAFAAAASVPSGVIPRPLDTMCSQHLVSVANADKYSISRRPVQPGEFESYNIVGGKTAPPKEVAVIPIALNTCDINRTPTGVNTVVLSNCLVVPGLMDMTTSNRSSRTTFPSRTGATWARTSTSTLARPGSMLPRLPRWPR